MVRAGHEVTVATTIPSYHATGEARRYSGQRRLSEVIDGMKIERSSLHTRPSRPNVARGWWQLTTAMSLWQAARSAKPFDAAFVLSPPLFLGLTAAALRVPFVMNVQDLFPQSAIDLGVLKPGMVSAWLRRIERFIYRQAAHITVHSEGNRAAIEATGVPAAKISVLPNWVDTDELRPGHRKNAFSHAYGLDGKFVVSFAGVLGISLGIQIVAEAADKLRQHSEVRFLVVGSGPEESRLQARIVALGLANVTLLPMQPKNLYPEILAASDVGLVLLSPAVKTPVVPGKINSIMAAGRPILASVPLEGDAAKLVRSAAAGVVTPAGDAQALADAILRLRADPAGREQYGFNGRRYAEQQLSLSKAVFTVESLLRHVSRGTMR